MRPRLPSTTRFAHAAALQIAIWVGRVQDRLIGDHPADFSIALDDLYRLEAHLALALTRLGTVQFPASVLERLADCLDARSHLRVLLRSRRSVGPGTVRLVEAGAAVPDGDPTIRAVDDYYGPGGPDAFHYPYAMHPWVYALGWDRRVAALRRRRRRFRLFFAGVVNGGYAERFDFPILPRPAVVECLVDSFRADACVVERRADLAALRRTDRPIALVLFGGDVTPTASNHFLGRPAYLRMLAGSDFALCPPGVFMPHSHNLVEALAVGTVPVLNYAGFCRPRLTHGVDCLEFATPDDLVAAVRRALAMAPTAVETLRRAASRRYDADLSPEAAARHLGRFLDGAGPAARLVLNREFNAARAWSAAHASG